MSAGNFQEVGLKFVQLYYSCFDTNRSQLADLYNAGSMMTFEGQQFQGKDAIAKKISELPFGSVSHALTTVDCQPTEGGGVLVYVVGQLKADNDPPHSFSQCFVLMPQGGSFYVLNDMFRLSLHNG